MQPSHAANGHMRVCHAAYIPWAQLLLGVTGRNGQRLSDEVGLSSCRDCESQSVSFFPFFVPDSTAFVGFVPQ